jgi:hypothetical protein
MEYEYESRSDSDEEPCGYENVWNEVNKRIRVSVGKISVKIFANDDPSVLIFLENIIKQGVSMEFLGYQSQIESLHNAIVYNPSNGTKRIKNIYRLEKLCAESTEPILSKVFGLEIPNASGFMIPFPNVKFLTIGNPDKNLIENVMLLPKLEYLTLEGSIPIFTMFKGFDSLELLTLKNIQSCYQLLNLVCTSALSRYIAVHVVDMRIPEFVAESFRNKRVQCTNITVDCEDGGVDYQEWRVS